MSQELLEFKAASGTYTIDEMQGIVECFVAGIGNKDSVGDIVLPGAFTESLKRRKPRVVWGHDWNAPIGKVLEIYEVPPSDPRLPSKMRQARIGGLFARVQFNLKSERGREAFNSVVFFGEEQEWSIGYKTLDSIFSQEKQANLLKVLELYEVSPVLHGANQLTATVSIKSEKQDTEKQVDSFQKSKWKKFDPSFAEMIRTEYPEIWRLGGNIKGNDQYRALKPISDRGGKATSQAEINALELREAWAARHYEDFRPAGVMAQIKWLAVGSRGEAYMKRVIREEIEKRKPAEKNQPNYDLYEKNDDEISIKAVPQGALVRWNSSGGTSYGKVVKIVKSGTISASPEGPEMEGTEENPAFGIRVYKPGANGWSPTDTVVVHRASGLSPIDQFPETKSDQDFFSQSEKAPSASDLTALTDAVGLDPVPQERVTGDVLRGYGPRRGNLERLLRYWRPIMRREGGFRRCRVILADHPELYPLNNICAWLHHETTGLWPNEGCHHPGMKNCRRKMRNVMRGSIWSDSDWESRLRSRFGKGKSVFMELADFDGDGEITEADIRYANEVLKEFLDMNPEFVRELGDESNWIHVGEDDMGEEHEHPNFWSSEDDDEEEEDGDGEEKMWNYLSETSPGLNGRESGTMPQIPMGRRSRKPGGCGCGCGGKSGKPSDLEEKAGRVISSSNMAKLRQALSMLQEVLVAGGEDIQMKELTVPALAEEIKSLVDPIADFYGIDIRVADFEVQIADFDRIPQEAKSALDSALHHVSGEKAFIIIDTEPQNMMALKTLIDEYSPNAYVVIDEENGEWMAVQAKTNEFIEALTKRLSTSGIEIKGYGMGELEYDCGCKS